MAECSPSSALSPTLVSVLDAGPLDARPGNPVANAGAGPRIPQRLCGPQKFNNSLRADENSLMSCDLPI